MYIYMIYNAKLGLHAHFIAYECICICIYTCMYSNSQTQKEKLYLPIFPQTRSRRLTLQLKSYKTPKIKPHADMASGKG